MEFLIILTIACYMSSSAAYCAYLFIQKDYLQRGGCIALAVGSIWHTAHIIYRIYASGHMPVGNLRDTLSLAGWAIAGLFLIVFVKYKLKVLGTIAAPLVTVVMIIVSQLPGETSQAAALLKHFWLISHVIAIFIGEAGFALACGLGLLYLIQENAIKTKKRRFFFKRLPSLDLLDAAGYACIVVGFTMLTIGLITGFVYARSVWGRFWSWDPKEVWSGITWLFYAALLHERLTVGWRGRRSAIMAIIGFGVILFTFLGVNFLLEGHHRDFTKF